MHKIENKSLWKEEMSYVILGIWVEYISKKLRLRLG